MPLMFDRILVSRMNPGDLVALKDYKPEDSLIEQRLLNPGSRVLTVIFPPWHGRGKLMETLEHSFIKRGDTVLSYRFHDHIFEADVQSVIRSFKYLQKTIAEYVNKLNKENTYDEIHLLSLSSGVVALAMVSSKLDRFTKVTTVVPGSNFALWAWDGGYSEPVRQEFKRLGVTRDQLDRAWSAIAPSKYVKYMKNKEVNILISSVDKFIPTKYQEEYKDLLVSSGAKVHVKKSRNGHGISILRYCLSSK